MSYTVMRIDEDIDFGCEERRPGAPVMAVVTLESEDGEQLVLKQVDQYLYDAGIDEGDRVTIGADRKLVKEAKL